MDGNEFVTSPEDDGIVNWEVGDQIVIASSSYNYKEQDVRTITGISDNGDDTSTLTLNKPLTYRHYGESKTYGETVADPDNHHLVEPIEFDLRAEVALLSRNVKIQGLSSEDTDEAFGDRWNLLPSSTSMEMSNILVVRVSPKRTSPLSIASPLPA